MNDVADNLAKQELPYSYVKKHQVLVQFDTEINDIRVLYHNELSAGVISELQRLFKKPLPFKKVTDEQFQSAVSKQYEINSAETSLVLEGMEKSVDLSQLIEDLPKTEDLLDAENDAPVIRLLNALFSQAIKEGASDIHIETFEEGVNVRMRVDGVLRVILEIQRALAPLVISRIKVMAKLDIAEKRIPQDGRLRLKLGDHNVDVRVSTLPSNHGERVVMRILDKKSSNLDLSLLGTQDDDLNKMRQLIAKPHGIILVTGPTGSGKSTTLYAMLNDLNETSRNILTIEDPIEYDLNGIGQTQVNSKIDMTFAKGLRAILRQDPDVVMVGEIRDIETAEIAVQASLTGHLVLSTLHTNSAISAVTRLKDMGVEPFLISSSLQGLIAQRLVRKLCPHCKAPYQATDKEMARMGLTEPVTLYQQNGCEKCLNQGFIGRTGIYEVIIIDEALREAIHNDTGEQALLALVRKNCQSITHDGFNRVLNGITTLTEVLRVSHS